MIFKLLVGPHVTLVWQIFLHSIFLKFVFQKYTKQSNSLEFLDLKTIEHQTQTQGYITAQM